MKNKQLVTYIGIGIVVYLLLRKKKTQAQARSGAGGGGGSFFSPSNLSNAEKNKISAKVKKEVDALNLTPIPDDWQSDISQYQKDIKNCSI
jgi:hypothetical protein